MRFRGRISFSSDERPFAALHAANSLLVVCVKPVETNAQSLIRVGNEVQVQPVPTSEDAATTGERQAKNESDGAAHQTELRANAIDTGSISLKNYPLPPQKKTMNADRTWSARFPFCRYFDLFGSDLFPVCFCFIPSI